MRRIAAALLFVLSLVCCFTLPICAQEGSATLTGFIQDSSKAVIPGVRVTAIARNTNQHFDATTAKDGSYTIVSLPVGPYQIQVEKPGFKTILKDDLFLHTQDTLQINFEMAVGSTSETVTVNSTTINESPSTGLIVDREFVDSMPLDGRSFQDLISLTPGAVTSAGSPGGYLSINGQRNDSNTFTVDGVSANAGATQFGTNSVTAQVLSGSYPATTVLGTTQDLSSVDSLQEFRVQTSGYSAEYGRQPGGQIEITTRAGTNQFHGTAFDYLRNTVFDANNWFANNTEIPRQAEHQNDFGGTFGGPVVIPGLYHGQDKTFFFFSYEGLRLLLPHFTSDASVPTLALRQSAAPGVEPFLNNQPLPNGPANPDGITALFSEGYSNPESLNNTSARIDRSFGHGITAFFRFADTPSNSEARGAQAVVYTGIDTTSTFGATAQLRPRIVDEFRFNYTHNSSNSVSFDEPFGGSTPLPLNLLVPSQYQNTPGGYQSLYSIYAPSTSLNIGPVYEINPTRLHEYNLVDSLSWTFGKHTVKFGADYRRVISIYSGGAYLTFAGLSSVAEIQSGIADYLYTESRGPVYPLFQNLSLYAQDSWKTATHWTLYYGLRWELNPAPGVSQGPSPWALTSSNLAVTEVAPQGASLYKTRYNNFAPRFGFAWQLGSFKEHPLVLRAGAGVFYHTGQAQAATSSTDSFVFPFTIQYNVFTNVALPFSMSELTAPPLTVPMAGATLPPPYSNYNYTLSLTDPNLKTPYTLQWNASLDVAINSTNTLTTSFVGNGGRQLTFYHGLSEFPGNPNFPSQGAFDAYYVLQNLCSSSYNALQVLDQGRLFSKLQVIASYTLSHAIDNTSTDNPLNQGPERGNSDNDISNVFTSALNFEGLSIKGPAPWTELVNAWGISARLTAESGYPLSIVQSSIGLPNGGFEDIFPDLNDGVPIYLHGVANVPGGWKLNPAAFSPVPTNSSGVPSGQGTLGRNYVHGPSFFAFNAAVQRRFPISDRLGLNFRAEAFNILNHPNFSGIDTNLPDLKFGEATNQTSIGAASQLYGMGTPRSLQFTLRLQF